MYGIGLDRGREVLPDRPRRRLGGIGGAHEIAQAQDGALALEHDAACTAPEVMKAPRLAKKGRALWTA